MKTFFLIAFLCLFLVAAELPPQLPSSFYGEVFNGSVNQLVTNNINPNSYTYTRDYNGLIVYSMDISNGNEGDIVYFYINGSVVGSGIYHIGTNQRVDLTVSETRISKRHKRIKVTEK